MLAKRSLLPIVITLLLVPLMTDVSSAASSPPTQNLNCLELFNQLQIEIEAGGILQGWMTTLTGEQTQGRVSYSEIITFANGTIEIDGRLGFYGLGQEFLSDRTTYVAERTHLFAPGATDRIQVFITPEIVQIVLQDWGDFTHEFVPDCSDGLWYGFGREGRDTSYRELFIIYLNTR